MKLQTTNAAPAEQERDSDKEALRFPIADNPNGENGETGKEDELA